jgi:hypothetical protein
MSCTPNTPIKWNDIYNIGDKLDTAIFALDVNATVQLMALEYPLFSRMRFIETDIDYFWHFDPATVTDPCDAGQLLEHGMNFAPDYFFRDAETYAYDNQRLYFVGARGETGDNANGPCFCCITGLVVSGQSQAGPQRHDYRLEPARSSSCNTSPVWYAPCSYFPQFNAPMTLAIARGSEVNGGITRQYALCEGSDKMVTVGYRWVNGINVYRLAYYKIPLKGFFGWDIRRYDFEVIFEKMNEILASSCGAKVNALYETGTSQRVRTGCPVRMDQLAWTFIKQPAFAGHNQPGCIATATAFELLKPWLVSTCGPDVVCGNEQVQSVYCNTIQHLNKLADSLSVAAQPRYRRCDDDCVLTYASVAMETRWVACSFVPCGITSADVTDKTVYSTFTKTYQGFVETFTYVRNLETGACSFSQTSCSGTTTTTDRLQLTFNPDDTPSIIGGSGFEEVVTVTTHSFNEETKLCETHSTYSGTSEIHVTYDPDSIDVDGEQQYNCSRTFSAVNDDPWVWSGPSGNSCVIDHYVSVNGNTWLPGFSSVSTTSVVYVPNPTFPENHPTNYLQTYSIPPEPTCDFPEFPPYTGTITPDNNAWWNGKSRGRGGQVEAYYRIDINNYPERRKAKYRIVHQEPSSCYLRVWFRKTTTTTVADEENEGEEIETVTIDDDLPPYVWNGGSGGCETDDTLVTGEEIDLEVPEPVEGADPADVKAVVTVLKYSFLSDYEPDVSDPTNPQPNGWPDPSWQASPP